MIKVKKISVKETFPIRLEILRKNIALPYKFDGDFNDETFHLGVFKHNTLIAVSSYMKVKHQSFQGKQYQLRGMATLNKYQGLGAAKLMLQEAVSILSTLKVDCLWCNARIIAVDFYKKQGFQIFGDLFEVKQIGGHYTMFKNLINE